MLGLRSTAQRFLQPYVYKGRFQLGLYGETVICPQIIKRRSRSPLNLFPVSHKLVDTTLGVAGYQCKLTDQFRAWIAISGAQL